MLPLDGIRVVDITWAWAGPYCSLQLAHLGAEVIRIESHLRPDMNRRVPPYPDNQPGLNRGGSFNQWNQGKLSLSVDLTKDEGTELVRDLIAKSDVVVENYAPGVLARRGLDYERLREHNPGLIMISLSGYGATGPTSNYVAYGTPLVMISGLASLSGYQDGLPSEVGLSYADPNAGLHGAFAVLAALWHRDESGEGQYIDLSQWESLLAIMPEGLMAQVLTGGQPPRMGNRDVQMAPHGYFRCRGDQRWVSISVGEDTEWRSLCSVLGRPELGEDPRFATAAARKAHEDELEAIVSAWTLHRDPWDVTQQLQAAGVAAFPVQDCRDLVEDEHLEGRDFFVRLPHPEVGVRTHAGIPWHLSDTPLAVRRPAPLLGGDNEQIVMQILGRSRAEYDRLTAEGVLH
jgi:crotonobetainyl-CoA:carnitine CoA-transferase CaiB-like acyl-CoA transferase